MQSLMQLWEAINIYSIERTQDCKRQGHGIADNGENIRGGCKLKATGIRGHGGTSKDNTARSPTQVELRSRPTHGASSSTASCLGCQEFDNLNQQHAIIFTIRLKTPNCFLPNSSEFNWKIDFGCTVVITNMHIHFPHNAINKISEYKLTLSISKV